MGDRHTRSRSRSRRHFLKTTPLLAGAMGLAGCNGGGDDPGDGTEENSGDTSTPTDENGDGPNGGDQATEELPSDEEELIEAADPPDEIVITDFPVTAMAPVYYALDTGMFEDKDLNARVTEQPIFGGANTLSSLLSGQTHVALATPVGAINLAREQERFPKMLAGQATVDTDGGAPGPTFLIAAEDSSFEEVSDLEGQTLSGFTGDPGLLDISMRWLLDDAGLDHENDVTYQSLSLDEIAGAVARGDIDAGVTIEPRILSAMQGGLELRRLAPAFGWLSPGIINATWVSSDFAESNPATTRLIQMTIHEALSELQENQEEFVEINADRLDIDESILEEMLNQGHFGIFPESFEESRPVESLETIQENSNTYLPDSDSQVDVTEFLLPWNQ